MAPNGGDYIDVRGKTRHIYGYLKDFMFDPSVVLDKVGTLSGGQKNRLKLAKILADPKTCLILDEPTNDLDMETLDMLEEILINYEGTLLLVSHDRDFLDQTVTKVLAFEGDGKIEECIGGYSDYLNQKRSLSKNKHKKEQNFNQVKKVETKKELSENKKLTYKLEYELKNLPKQIEDKEIEIDSKIDTNIPSTYISNIETKLEIYRRVSQADNQNKTNQVKKEMEDRFGMLPTSVRHCLAEQNLKNTSRELGIEKISIRKNTCKITVCQKNKVDLRNITTRYNQEWELRIQSPTQFQITKKNGKEITKEFELT